MKQIDVLDRTPGSPDVVADEEWDHFLAGRRGVDVQQSSAWGRVKAGGHSVHRAVIRDQAGEIVAGAQMLVRSFGRVVRVGYVPFGPVAVTDEDALSVVERLEEIGREIGLSVLLVHPARTSSFGGPRIGSALAARGYRQASTEVATSATVELALDGDIDSLRRGYSRSRRKNLKSARRAGVVVRRCGPEGIETFHELHTGSARRNGFSPMSLDYLERQCSELGLGRHAEIAIGEVDGEPTAAGFFTVFNGRIDFKMTGWNPTLRSRQACVNDAVQDHMIEWAVDAGLDVFDLGGLPRRHAELLLDPDVDPSELDATGTGFKRSWGGEVVLGEPTYELLLRPLGHLGYRLPARLLADHGLGGRIVNWMRRS